MNLGSTFECFQSGQSGQSERGTTRVLMATLLVHDLYVGLPDVEHPWRAEAHQACHGGLWRAAFAPRSALGLAALLGYGASRP